MKQMIRKRLSIVILTTMLFSLFLNYNLQIHNARSDMYRNVKGKFRQIEQILDQNEQDVEAVKQNLKEDCFIRAKAAAYIVQNRPEVIDDLEELRKIADLLQVDEFHLFDEDGNLYGGSQPKYYGLNFNSGEQMRFFLPMLEDKSLQLCQDITPNTAEQKLMQYAAVWREDGKGIVQIGLEPDRVLDTMKKNELSYIFSVVTAEPGSVIYAIDPDTFTIRGATQEGLDGRHIKEIGLDPQKILNHSRGFQAEVNRVASYCVFETSDSVILGVTRANQTLYHDVNRSTLFLALYMAAASLIMITFLSGYIDRYIVDGISAVNKKLIKITKGNLDTRVEVKSTPEFKELSNQINQMVESLLDSTNKLSKILETAQVPIGVYEYNKDMKRVRVTSRLAEILKLSAEEQKTLFSDYNLFEERLEELRLNPLEQDKRVYRLAGREDRFLRLETFYGDHSNLGMIMDVTDDILEKRRLEQERDIDVLTGLLSRRAFYRQMEDLFQKPEQIGHGLLMMADSDHLKMVNDRYGHESGDRYLRAAADILRSCKAEKKITARLSGDEFVLFLYGCQDKETLLKYVEGVYEVMEDSMTELNNNEWIPVRFSAGCSFYPENGTDLQKLLKLADEAMYKAKSTDGSRVVECGEVLDGPINDKKF